MNRGIVLTFALWLISFQLAIGQELTQSQQDRILNALKPEYLVSVTTPLVTEEENSFKALISTMLYVGQHLPLPSTTTAGLKKLADSNKNGFKELYASEILLEAGLDLSEKAINRIVEMAHGRITDKPLAEEKKRLAVRVLQTYAKLIEKRKQTQ